MPIEMICQNCNNPFYCYPSDAETGRKFCSLTCRSNARSAKELPAASRTPVDFTCKECDKPFTMMQSYLTAYRKKFSRDPMYCSMSCSYTGQRKAADERNKFVCQHCGKEDYRDRKEKLGGRIYRQQKYCDHDCKVEAQKQNAMHRFQNGGYKKHTKRNGYVWITVPELARTGGKRNVMEHRYVMSKKLGRELLPDETVHHVNGIRSDNGEENLELFSSRHGPGQRVVDKVQFAIEILTLYPEFAKAAGYELHHVSAETPAIPAT